MSKEYTPDLTKHLPHSSKHTPICLICSFGCWIHVWYVLHLDMWSVSGCQAMCIMDFPFASLVPHPRCCFRPECERLESESQLCESGSDRFVFERLLFYFWPWQHRHSRESTCWVPEALEALDLFRSQLQFNTFLCFGQLDCNVYIYISHICQYQYPYLLFSLLLSKQLGTVRCNPPLGSGYDPIPQSIFFPSSYPRSHWPLRYPTNQLMCKLITFRRSSPKFQRWISPLHLGFFPLGG